MKGILHEEKTIRKFLLGEMAETERAALEDRLLADEEFFALIEDAENDLVDDYVGGRFTARERDSFENYYLAHPENRAKVETARVLQAAKEESKTNTVAEKDQKNETGFWQSIRSYFTFGKLAPVGFAVIVLLFLSGILWFVFRPPTANEIVYSPATVPTPEKTPPLPPQINSNSFSNSNQTVPPENSENKSNVKTVPKETPRAVEPKSAPTPQTISPATVTLALVAGLVRGGGAANKLILPKDAGQVRLMFDLPAKNYSAVEARIETVAGEIVWRGKISGSKKRIALNLPAKIFADEDYLLIVSGTNDIDERKDFAQFYFNAERK